MAQDQYKSASIWLSKSNFAVKIESSAQINQYNGASEAAVYLDVTSKFRPDIQLVGGKSDSVCIWSTQTRSGFVSKPKHSASFHTLRFVSRGSITYAAGGVRYRAFGSHATMTGFEDLEGVEASQDTEIVSATFTQRILDEAQRALTGDHSSVAQPFAPVAETTRPGMMALFQSVVRAQRRIRDINDPDDLVFPLLQEVLCFQLLTVWPRIAQDASRIAAQNRDIVEMAIDYIEANLQRKLTLAEVSSVTGVGARALQKRFQAEIGKTPIQFIIDRRLSYAHRDLMAERDATVSVKQIARRWGFVHMSDFAQRYRRLYGLTPIETRRSARLG